MSKKPLIISTDPGIDDAAAITICLFAQEFDLKLIVPTWGNVSLPKTLRNTLKLQTFLKTHVPVVAGSRLPLVKKPIDASNIHGQSGMAGWQFPEPDMSLLHQGIAVDAIHKVIAASEEKMTLMAIGPLTDMSLFIRQYPDDLAKVAQLVIMGGAIGRGNYGPLAEYNIAGDPEAAKIVFESGLKIKVAPLEIGAQAKVLPETSHRVRAMGPVGEMIYSLFNQLHDGTIESGLEIYDALAAGILLEPDMFDFKAAHVEIETKGTYTYGASAIDFKVTAERPANAQIAVQINQQAFANWFSDRIQAAENGANLGK